MNSSTRSQKSFKNIIIALFFQSIGIIISFFARIVFIKNLGTDYLGINGLFTNILTILSLVELGIGPAIVFCLYKPLSEKKYEQVKAIMSLYKKVYIIIGLVIFFLGLCIMPFINYFIKSGQTISDNVHIIFILFVLNTSISYFYSYKRNIIIADQNRYIATIYRYVCFIILNIIQLVLLIYTKNYYLFLILQVLFTFIENYLVSKKADKLYPFLNEPLKEKIDKNTIEKIKKNTKAMVYHKIGGIVVSSTDNVLISKIVGLISVGIYSNYQMVITALNTIIIQFFQAIVASIGNLGVKEKVEKQIKVFNSIFFINYLIYGFCSCCLLLLFNPFIKLWVGKELIFSFDVVIILTINFYTNGIRKTVLTFREALGIYWYDRYKAIIEAVVNLVSSIILGINFGVSGILIGTFISSFTCCLFVEPHILYKYGFNIKATDYYIKLLKYTLLSIIITIITYYLSLYITIGGLFGLILKGVTTFILFAAINYILFHNSEEYNYCINILKRVLKKQQ